MQNEITTWIGFWLEISRTLGPAVITALVSIALFRYQLKMKTAEIRGNSELKARELIFESYQKRIERISNGANEIGNAFGKLVPHMKELSNDEVTTGIVYFVKLTIDVFKEEFEELSEELEKSGLSKRKPRQIEFVKSTLSTKLDPVESINIQSVYLDFMKSIGIIFALRDDLLKQKSEDLFLCYLQNTKS